MEDIKQKVIQYFLKNTPVGEHKVVMEELSVLVGSDFLSSDGIKETLLECYAEHGTIIDTEGQLALICTQGRRDTFTYLDPKLKKLLTIDPLNLSVLEIVDSEEAAAPEFQEALDGYINKHYPNGQARVFAKEGGFDITISAPSVNLRNFWTGEWVSTWNLQNEQLTGHLTFKAHYFEEGNLQFSHTTDVQKNGVHDPTSLVNAIFEKEDEIHRGLHSVYEEMPAKCFKHLRRTMPVTHTKFADIHRTKMVRDN